MNLSGFLDSGISRIAETAGRYYLNSHKGRMFMARTASTLKKSAATREKYERAGTHVPPFLIASIATSCNLRCAGCYARANGGCDDSEGPDLMGPEDWGGVFQQAEELGVSFIMLAGGEPLMEPGVIHRAAERTNIIFPIFTNGTMINGAYLDLFDAHRNMVPVLSIEGDDAQTDAHRGTGVAGKVRDAARSLRERGILYGASVTVTTENMHDVTEPAYMEALRAEGCGLVFFVEYVPVEEGTEHLVLSPEDLEQLQERVDALYEDGAGKGMIILSFPGDEEAMGGCLAAGRGFFHINPAGGAEPCPFSPYSEMNVREKSLLEVLQSDFFARVREISTLEPGEHMGGCTLFNHQDEVTDLAKMQAF